jgi:hypothetical protein
MATDNVVLNPGALGATVRTVAKTVNAVAQTQFALIDVGGGLDGSPEVALVAGQQVGASSLSIVHASDSLAEPGGSPISGVALPPGGAGLTGWLSALLRLASAPAANYVSPEQGVVSASEASAPTYHACTGLFAPAANPTDVFAFYPTGQSPTPYVKRIVVSGLSTSGGAAPVRLQLTSNSNINTGTIAYCTVGNGYLLKHDNSDGTPNGSVQYWTANPTSRNGVSGSRQLISEQDLVFGTSGTSAGTPVVFEFSKLRNKSVAMKYSSNYALAINFNAAALPAGAQLRIEIEWEERRLLNVAFVGDSTTSNATLGYLHGAYYNGGFGATGALNNYAIANNFGSNGFRLADYLNNLGGVLFPLGTVQGTGTGSPSTTSAIQTVSAYQNVDVLVLTYGINDIRQGLLGSSQAAATNRLVALIDTAIYAALSGTVSGASYTSPLATAYTISAISWSAGVATVTTSATHQFSTAGSGESYSGGGVAVTISGSSNTAFNGTWQLASVVSSTQFTLNMASNPGTFSGTAQEQFATIWYGTFSAMPSCKIILYSPNSFTADDSANGASGTGYYMYYPQSSGGALVGLWSGMTLAQAAQAASTILYNAYVAFQGDSRVFALVHQQSAGGGPFPSTVTTLANNPLMQNQLHPGAYGQRLKAEQIGPYIINAVKAIAAARF